jgi:hypothetical protein
MRPSERLWAESELGAGGPPAACDRTWADGPARGNGGAEADRDLARRLARLPAAHPSARPDVVRPDAARPDAAGRTAIWSAAVWATADWSDRELGGDRISEDAWWRGESDIWWRIPDGSAGEADYDDIAGLGDYSELADSDYVAGGGGSGGPDDVDGEGDGAGETDDQGGGTGGRPAGRTAGPAGRDPVQRNVHWGNAVGPRVGPDHGSYRPWFSPDISGDPWFAAGLE